MDSFTQQMMETTNARQLALKEKMEKLANSSARKRRTPLSENLNAPSVATPSGEDKKRMCMSSSEEEDCLSTPSRREKSNTPERAQKRKIKHSEDVENQASTNDSNVGNRGRSRFAALAATISQWESEEIQGPSYRNNFQSNGNVSNSTANKKSNSSPLKGPSKTIISQENENVVKKTQVCRNSSDIVRKSPQKSKPEVEPCNVDVKKKICVWDKAVVATLEAQGFTKSPSASKISYDYNTPDKKLHETAKKKLDLCDKKVEPKKQEFPKSAQTQKSSEKNIVNKNEEENAELSVSERISMFSKPQKRKSSVDPALMSLSARVALFEKAMDKPVKQPARAKFEFNQNKADASPKKVPAKASSPIRHSPIKVDVKPTNVESLSPSKTSASNLTKHVHQTLMKQVSGNWQNNDICSKAKAERAQELENLRNRFERASKGSSTAPKDDYIETEESQEEDYDQSEPEQEDELFDRLDEPDVENAQEREIVAAADSSLGSIAEDDEEEYTADVSSDVAEACGEIDRMLDEVLEDQSSPEIRAKDEIEIVTKPGNLYPSLDAFKAEAAQSPPAPPPPKKVEPVIDNAPLMHTVSFYRRQNDMRKTPVRKLVRREEVCSPPSPSEQLNQKQVSIHQQVKELQENINAQQTIISQTSQALNLCRATAEFYGSSEQIEGERLLLIATQRRQACLNEITRLKTEGAMMAGKSGKNYCESEGVLTISDIRLPLKKAFIVATAEGKNENYVHNFLCLIRHGAQIIATEMISTQQGALSSGSLTFSNMITIHNLESEFNVIFEVYGLQCPKEMLPHDRKYHIKKESSKLKLTPKKKQDMRLLTSPAISSPGGPLAIRTSSFAIIGHARLRLSNLNRKVFVLEKVPATSPLEGNVYMKVQCHADLRVDQHGFLTMFEDVSGFGAWHRRWCVLTGQHLAYWKYPDDEKKKEPIGYVDLRRCITGCVETAPREMCARLNTFLMVTMRPTRDEDEEDLITKKYDTMVTTKHLLSADSKEEKTWWCEKINQALGNIRKWDPNAMRPVLNT